jgi:PhnB protein
MKEVTAYLNFDGHTRQAMQFYSSALGAKLDISTMPDESGNPSTAPDARIMHSQLTSNGHAILMASDMPPGSTEKERNGAVGVQCESVEEVDRIFAALAQGGTVSQPLMTAPWGARFGMLTDKYGVTWLLNCELPK